MLLTIKQTQSSTTQVFLNYKHYNRKGRSMIYYTQIEVETTSEETLK